MQFNIKDFVKTRGRNHFECGHRSLDRWFKNDAPKYAERCEIKTFTCHEGDRERAVGFFALQLGNESMNEVENKPNDYTKNRTAFPAVHLAYIGVDKPFQRRGIGVLMMTDIFDRVYAISGHAGLYALTLQSVNANSTKFYKRLGFTPYGGTEESPKMLMPVRTVIALVEDQRAATKTVAGS